MKLTIIYNTKKLKEIDFDKSINLEEVYNQNKDLFNFDCYLVKINGIYNRLDTIILSDSEVEYVDIRYQVASQVYQNSLFLLFSKAVHDLYSKKVKICVRNALNKGMYITSNKTFDLNHINEIKSYMNKLKEKSIEIKFEKVDYKTALNKVDLNQKDTINLIKTCSNNRSYRFYSIEDETLYMYGLTLPNTSYINLFDIELYKKGLILKYPHSKDPNHLVYNIDQKLLYDAFSNSYKWNKLLKINTLADLNQKVIDNNLKQTFLMQEALHEAQISSVAKTIKNNKKKVILICGPSSSGKTSFANRLQIQLKVLGLDVLCLGTDEYFVEKDEKPIDEDGKLDLESIEAVDYKLFIEHLKKLLNYETVDLPIYDFLNQRKIFGTRPTKINKNTVIIIEGIHSLNSMLTQGIDNELKYKIYISPLSTLSIDSNNRISSTDTRLLRRIVRDNLSRGYNAIDTIRQWVKVRKGEEKNIFPFIEEADVFFNSFLVFETSILKTYVKPLLEKIDKDCDVYCESLRLLNFLKYYLQIEDTSVLNNNSILKEFIGGSSIVD